MGLENGREANRLFDDAHGMGEERLTMFCSYPVALPFYLIGAAVLIFAIFPRYLETVVKSKFVWLGGALAFVAGMLLLPSQNHLLGDGMTHLANPERTYSNTEPLEVLLHHLVYLVVGSSVISYQVVAFAAGLFYLLAIYLMSRLGSTPLERGIIALALLCTATVQFYFGYVEHYTLLNLFALYYLYFSWRDIGNGRLTTLPLVFFLATFLSHLAAIVLLPSVYYLYWPRLKKWLFLLSIPIVAGGVVAAISVDVFKIVVPPWPNDFSAYSLLSVTHLSDLVMLLLLISPAFFLALWKGRLEPRTVFTLVALAGTLCFTVLIDPKIGALRDWDLLSIFAIPLAALIALRAPRHRLTAVTLMILIVIRIVPWLTFNSRLQAEFIKRSVQNDLHYSVEYDQGQRLVSWGLLLYKLGDWKGAEAAWKEKLSYTPDHMTTLAMLAPLQFKMGEYPEAYQDYLRMLILEPDSLKHRYRAGYLLFRIGENDGALSLLYDAPPEFRENPSTARLLAGILAAKGRHQEAVTIIEKTPGEDADGYLPYVLAKSCLAVGRRDLAWQLIQRAKELDPLNRSYWKLADEISASQTYRDTIPP